MALPTRHAAAKTGSLTVFTGSTATLLRAGGAQLPAGFVAQDVIYTATLDRATHRMVARAPLLHSAILHGVGEKMTSLVATDLAREFAQTGRVTQDSIVLKVAASQVPAWVQQAIQTQAPGLRLWKKTRLTNAVQAIKCAFSLTTAGIGLASAAASFGATSVPAVLAAWSALAESADFLVRSWQDVRRAEQVMLDELARIYAAYAPYKAGQKRAGGTAAIAGKPGGSRTGAHLRGLADSALQATRLDIVSGASGKGVGPSPARLRAAVLTYEGKLAHLIAEANTLTGIVMTLLDLNAQLAGSGVPADQQKLLRNEALIHRMIGDTAGSIGVSRKRSLFAKPVSILWLQAYYTVGKDVARKVRLELVDLLAHTPLHQLDAQGRAAELLVSIGKWLGGNHEALSAGSAAGFADAVFCEDNAVSTAKIQEVAATIKGWASQASSVADALRRRYPDEAESDLAKECQTDYRGAATELGEGALGVYDTIRGKLAPSLPDINPQSQLHGLVSGAL